MLWVSVSGSKREMKWFRRLLERNRGLEVAGSSPERRDRNDGRSVFCRFKVRKRLPSKQDYGKCN